MTAWRMPAAAASPTKPVDESGARRHLLGHPLHPPQVVRDVDLGGVEFADGPAGEEVDADRSHQRFGEPVVDEPEPGGASSSRCHHGGGSPHAGRQIPGVVLGARHD